MEIRYEDKVKDYVLLEPDKEHIGQLKKILCSSGKLETEQIENAIKYIIRELTTLGVEFVEEKTLEDIYDKFDTTINLMNFKQQVEILVQDICSNITNEQQIMLKTIDNSLKASLQAKSYKDLVNKLNRILKKNKIDINVEDILKEKGKLEKSLSKSQ